MHILLVDDEPGIRLSLGDALEEAGHRVRPVPDGKTALKLLQELAFDLVISDIRMPGLDGLSLFEQVRQRTPSTDFILITGHGTIADAVMALQQGAYDYLTKPFGADEITMRVARLAEKRGLQAELSRARAELERGGPARLIGHCRQMVELDKRIRTMAGSDLPVLIHGESGTGKELVARALHDRSARREGPWIAVHCAALPENLLESELFGHVAGAFTGAVRSREGRFQAASGGSLFLDEIGEIPLLAQVKLLRVLQEGRIQPLGSDASLPVDVRVIAATHRDLKELMALGKFREDLYFRINVLDIEIPPLRERRSDLPLLTQHFLRMVQKTGDLPEMSPSAWAALSSYDYPGNVRELEHAISHASVLSAGGVIELHHLPRDLRGPDADQDCSGESLRPLSKAVKEFERQYLRRALKHSGGKKTQAARLLGISRKTLWEKLRVKH